MFYLTAGSVLVSYLNIYLGVPCLLPRLPVYTYIAPLVLLHSRMIPDIPDILHIAAAAATTTSRVRFPRTCRSILSFLSTDHDHYTSCMCNACVWCVLTLLPPYSFPCVWNILFLLHHGHFLGHTIYSYIF